MIRTNVQVPLMWPITVSHKIDVSSPLYDFGPQQLADGMMEVKIIVMIVLLGIYLLCIFSSQGGRLGGGRARLWCFH